MSQLHYFFALLLSLFSAPMAHNGRGATKREEAKNGTASNRDNLPTVDFNLASRVLDQIGKGVS
jgi:hypothetical protein